MADPRWGCVLSDEDRRLLLRTRQLLGSVSSSTDLLRCDHTSQTTPKEWAGTRFAATHVGVEQGSASQPEEWRDPRLPRAMRGTIGDKVAVSSRPAVSWRGVKEPAEQTAVAGEPPASGEEHSTKIRAGLATTVQGLKTEDEWLLLRSLQVAQQPVSGTRKRRRRRKDKLSSTEIQTLQGSIDVAGAKFSDSVVAYCDEEEAGSKISVERCADVREAYGTLRYLNGADPEAFYNLLDSADQLGQEEEWASGALYLARSKRADVAHARQTFQRFLTFSASREKSCYPWPSEATRKFTTDRRVAGPGPGRGKN